MKIGFDASILDQGEPTGVPKSFASLLRALGRNPGAHEYFLFTPTHLPSWFEAPQAFQTIEANRAGPGPLWRERLLPGWVGRFDIDILHSPLSAFSLLSSCKKICTIHEIPWKEKGMRGDEGRRFSHRAWAFLAASHADAIVCVSRTTAKHLSRQHPAADAKIRTIYHGLEENFLQEISEDTGVLKKYDLPRSPYFLCLGQGRSKKNPLQAVRALRVFLDRTGAPHSLVLAGTPGPATEGAVDMASRLGIGRRVLTPGYIAEQDLPSLYGKADALLYLSYSEGFGLPPLEAMGCRTPVIGSDRGAIPEICGEAAVLVSPEDPMGIAEAMRLVVGNPVARGEFIEKGRRRVASFSWDRTAQQVQDMYGDLE